MPSKEKGSIPALVRLLRVFLAWDAVQMAQTGQFTAILAVVRQKLIASLVNDACGFELEVYLKRDAETLDEKRGDDAAHATADGADRRVCLCPRLLLRIHHGDPRGRRWPGFLDQLCGGGTAPVSPVCSECSSIATDVPGQALVAAAGERGPATDPQDAAERQEGGHFRLHENADAELVDGVGAFSKAVVSPGSTRSSSMSL